MKISWNGFSKKSYQERLELLKAQALLSPEKQTSLEQDEQMSVAVADQLSENVVGTFSLPYSLVPEVLVNGQEYTVPYVTEEPLWLLRSAMQVKSSSVQEVLPHKSMSVR